MYKNLCGRFLGLSGRPNELIELALSFGFKGLNLDIVEFQENVQTHGLAHARRLLDSAKLRLGAFSLPVDWLGDDTSFRADLARLSELAALAAELGCTRTITLIEPGDDTRPFHQNFEFHRQRLAEVAKTLAASKVQLGLAISAAPDARAGKAFEFIRDYDALQMLLGMVGGANVGMVVDTWNLRASGGELESLRKIDVAKIVALELADAPPDVETSGWLSTRRLLPGETGVVDNVAALRMLGEMGYAGPVTPAPHPSRFQGLGREAIVKLAGAQLDQVWKAAGLSPAGKLQTSASR